MCNVEIGPRHVGQYPRMAQDEQERHRERERARQVKFLQYVFLGLMTMQEAARALAVSDATLDRIRADFLGDGRQDTDDLRKLELARKHQRANR